MSPRTIYVATALLLADAVALGVEYVLTAAATMLAGWAP